MAARGRKPRRIVLIASLVAVFSAGTILPSFGANIDVPLLELVTWGRLESGVFGFDTRGDMELRVDGGYKFAGRVLFGFSSSTLETAAFNDMLRFTAARVTLREIFGAPLNLTWFIGEAEAFCSGAVFPDLFGSPVIASRFFSFVHFQPEPGPPPVYYTYRGIYTPNGTGLVLDWLPGERRLQLSWYLYQDSSIDADADYTTLDWGHFSSDFRAAINLDRIKLEAFVGATYPVPDGTVGYYRGGLLFYAAEQSVEFLAQIGIPRWNPYLEAIDIDLLYLFVEPRVRFGAFAIAPSFFWRPRYFLNEETNVVEDTGGQAFDINLDLQVGKPAQWPVGGGLEGNFVYQTELAGVPVNEMRFKLSPYLRLLTSGVTWELRVPVNLFPLDASDPAQVFLTVQAEF
jgi:hypothetical protein